MAFQWKGTTGTTVAPSSGNWSAAASWQPGNGPPSAANDIVTFGGTTTYTVTLDTSETVGVVTLNASNATLAIGANTLTISSSKGQAGTLTNTAETISVAGGTISTTGGISNSGTISSSSTSSLTGGLSNSGTLNVTGGSLTVTGSLTDSGTVSISSGATLTDTSGITLLGGTLSGAGLISSSTNVTGSGTLAISFTTGTNTITASGGTLDVTGSVTTSQTFAIANVASSRLKLDHSGVTVKPISITTSNQTLEIAQNATINAAQTVSGGTLTIDNLATLTDASGITLAGGTLSGLGSIAANTNISGSGTVSLGISTAGSITASGGTLDLTGTVSGRTLAIDTVAGSHLTIDSSATTSSAITLNNSNQTLEVGAGHSLTVNANENYAGGHLQIDSGGTLTIGSTHTLTIASGATLTDNGGTITTSGVGGGIAVNGTLIGTGTVNGPLSGSGIVEASGGTLHLTSAVTNALGGYSIDGASSVLQLDSTLASNNIVFTFLSAASGGLGLSSDSALVLGNSDSMSGLNVSTGGVRTNFIDIEGHTVTVSSITHNGTTSGTVTLSDGAVLNLTNIANGSSSWFADTASDGSGGTYVFLSDAVCFMPGTRILTPAGEMAVEALKRGDLVTTAEGKSMPIRWLGRQTVSRLFADPLRVLPIRIKQGALGDNMPSRDLLVSPDHALLIDGALIQAGALVNDTSIVRETKVPERFTYYHVELADHSLIVAENTPAETFIDNIDRMAFDNWDEHDALPDAGDMQLVEMGYARAKACRQVPRATRDRLARRAAARNGRSQVA